MSSSNVVWAKMRYCSYWPAKIIDKPPVGITKQPKKCCVYFFGTRNYGFVDIKNLLSFVQHRTKLSIKGRGKYFKEAVTECDEYILNPIDSDEVEKREEVVLKTELDFDVKQENQNDIMCVSEVVKVSPGVQAGSSDRKVCRNCDIKDSEIATLKCRNENLICERNIKDLEYGEQIETLQVQNTSLKNEIEELNNKSRFMQTQHNVDVDRIAALNNQIGSLQNEIEETKSKIDRDYEVQDLLQHKKRKGKIFYLIRWKGYSADYDFWVEEEKLNCPAILTAYKKSKKLL